MHNFRKIIFLIISVSSLVGMMLFPASAQSSYSIKQMTPEVETALNNRRDRYEALRQLKAKGLVGENNKGYVEVLKDEEGATAVVQAENSDRKVVYRTIAEQNNLSGALETIEKVFAQVQKEKAAAGDKIQQDDGMWVTK